MTMAETDVLIVGSGPVGATWGLTAADVDRAVDVALGAPYANPRSPSADDLRAVLHAAWAGEPPYGG